MVKIKRIGALSLGKIFAVLYAFAGLIVGFFIALFSLVFGALDSSSGSGMLGSSLGIGAIILFPIIYGIMGFVFGLITASLYNLIVSWSWVGGLEVETEG